MYFLTAWEIPSILRQPEKGDIFTQNERTPPQRELRMVDQEGHQVTNRNRSIPHLDNSNNYQINLTELERRTVAATP